MGPFLEVQVCRELKQSLLGWSLKILSRLGSSNLVRSLFHFFTVASRFASVSSAQATQPPSSLLTSRSPLSLRLQLPAGTFSRSEITVQDAQSSALIKWSTWWGTSVASLSSSMLPSEIASFDFSQFILLFSGSEPSTLRRFVKGWSTFFEVFLSSATVLPSLPQLVAWCQAELPITSERGRGKALVKAVLHAIRFVSERLTWQDLRKLGSHGVFSIIATSMEGRLVHPKEAQVLWLSSVQNLETFLFQRDRPPLERIIAGVALTAFWGGLRFSDVRRVNPSSFRIVENIARFRVWRSKTARQGMNCAMLSQGFGGRNWVSEFLSVLGQHVQADWDSLFPSINGSIISYASSLRILHFILRSFQPEFNGLVTWHSMKATLLSWSLQCGVGAAERLCMGHHKAPGLQMLSLYGRDDCLGALRGQAFLLRKLSQGFRPLCPVDRGGDQPSPDPHSPLLVVDVSSSLWSSLTGDVTPDSGAAHHSEDRHSVSSGSDSSSSSGISSSSSSSDSPEGDAVSVWFITNRPTKKLHKAVQSSTGLQFMGKTWNRACNPAQGSQDACVTSTMVIDSSLSFCKHPGCARFTRVFQ